MMSSPIGPIRLISEQADGETVYENQDGDGQQDLCDQLRVVNEAFYHQHGVQINHCRGDQYRITVNSSR